ncbi:MAG: hypothetical protein QOE68_369 [Thermoanaerobaculia bacterium]|nr:hypothetical protein [Thermoanaerobaculia bacterium]
MNEGLLIAWSLDALLGLAFLSTPLIASAALIAGVAGGFFNLALRRTPATA